MTQMTLLHEDPVAISHYSRTSFLNSQGVRKIATATLSSFDVKYSSLHVTKFFYVNYLLNL